MAVGALVALGVTAATAATIVTVAKYAILVYGLYASQRARRKSQRAATNSFSDRSVSIGGTDMARAIVYGEREVDGRIVYVVEASDESKTVGGKTRPPSPYFYIVKALEPDHEVDRIIDLQFDGRSVGPFQGDPNDTTTGTYVAPGSHYYLSREGSVTKQGIVDSLGAIQIDGMVITRVLALAVSDEPFIQNPNSTQEGGPVYQTISNPSTLISMGVIVVGEQYAGKSYNLTATYQVNKPLVKVWFYRGTETQQANARITEMSGGEWNSNCRLIGTPYVVVEITPDFEKFPNLMPYITATVRGKHCLFVTGGEAYTRNPAHHIYDYLRSYIGARDEEINKPMLVATSQACEEVFTSGPETGMMRYACDAVLSTEDRMVDNLRYLLGSMAGNAVYSGGSFDIRCGVSEIAAGAWTEDDLASGALQVIPFTPMLETFNAVRGRYPRKVLSSAQGGIYSSDKVYRYDITDYPPIKSEFYISQDEGGVNWEQIDQPCVTSGFQVQRIAKLRLHLNRNGLVQSAEWKMSTGKYSPGQVVNVSTEALGFASKPFRLMQRKTDTKANTITWTMVEEPAAIYNWNYQEGKDPDPAPNTVLTPVDVVEAVTGITVETGPGVAEYAEDGSVRPIARITWARAASYGIINGGFVEIWMKFGHQVDWEKITLPGDTERLDTPIQRSIVIVGQIRFINAVHVRGPWVMFDKTASDTPTQWLVGNMLVNARFEHENRYTRPDTSYPEYFTGQPYLWGWRGVFQASTNGWKVMTGAGDLFLPPTPQPVDSTVASGLGVGFTGIAEWFDIAAMDYPIQYIASDTFAVDGLQRMIAFAWSWGPTWQENYIVARFIKNIGDELVYGYSSRSDPNTTGASLSEFKKSVLYADVPVGAVMAQLFLVSKRQDNLPNNFVTHVKWTKPYIGNASPGQVTEPPWSA